MARILIAAIAATLAAISSASAVACDQESADRLSARTDQEWAQALVRSYPIVGLYALSASDHEHYSFDLVEAVQGDAPREFTTQAFVVIQGCGIGLVDWEFETRSIGDRVLVLGRQGTDPFVPGLLFSSDSYWAVLVPQFADAPEEAP